MTSKCNNDFNDIFYFMDSMRLEGDKQTIYPHQLDEEIVNASKIFNSTQKKSYEVNRKSSKDLKATAEHSNPKKGVKRKLDEDFVPQKRFAAVNDQDKPVSNQE